MMCFVFMQRFLLNISVFTILLSLSVNGRLVGDMFGPTERLILNGKPWCGVTNHSRPDAQFAVGDMDNDGDMDIIVFELSADLPSCPALTYRGTFCYVENIGTPESYIFETRVRIKNVRTSNVGC